MLESNFIDGEKPFVVPDRTLHCNRENNRERKTAFDIKSGKHAWAESNKEEAPRPISPPPVSRQSVEHDLGFDRLLFGARVRGRG